MSDVKLPELPKADHRFQDPEGEQADIHVFTIDTLQTYASAAVELNRVVADDMKMAIETVITNLNNATAIMRDKRTDCGPNRAWLNEQVFILRAALAKEE